MTHELTRFLSKSVSSYSNNVVIREARVVFRLNEPVLQSLVITNREVSGRHVLHFTLKGLSSSASRALKSNDKITSTVLSFRRRGG